MEKDKTYADYAGRKEKGTQLGEKSNVCAVFTHRCSDMELRPAFVLLNDVVELCSSSQ